MKRPTRSAGLSLGAVLILTLGFLLASLLIFVFGIWVGKDLVERRLAQEERIVRKPADRAAVESRTSEADVTVAEQPRPVASAAAQPTGPAPAATFVRVVPVTATVAQVAAATATPVKVVAASTATRVLAHPTSTPARATGRAVEEWADAGWTVQVYATTDPNQATSLARRLLAKGYDAYTLQAPMRGQTWYRVRVGRFTSRERAAEMEQKLKKLEGMEAAYVTAQ